MDFPPPPPPEIRYQPGVSLAWRERFEYQILVVVYDGMIGNGRQGIIFFPELGSSSSTFQLKVEHRATPLTLESLISEVHEKHAVGDRFIITQLIYRQPTHGPNGNLKFCRYHLINNESVRSMISTARMFRDEVPQIELCIRGRDVVDPISSQLTPFSVDKRLTALYYNGTIRTVQDGVRFDCEDIKLCRLKVSCTYEQLKYKIRLKCTSTTHGLCSIYFRCPSDVGLGRIRWTQMPIRMDSDVEQMFNVYNDHRTRGPVELYTDFHRTIVTSQPLPLFM